MIAGIIAGITWAIETIVLGIALAMSPFVSTEQAIILAPFASTFLHDFFSAIWSCIYNGVKGNLPGVVKALKTKSGKMVLCVNLANPSRYELSDKGPEVAIVVDADALKGI